VDTESELGYALDNVERFGHEISMSLERLSQGSTSSVLSDRGGCNRWTIAQVLLGTASAGEGVYRSQ
jgi:hypothetical protein